MSASHTKHLDLPSITGHKIYVDIEGLKQQGYDTILFTLGSGEWRKYDIDKFADMLDCGLDYERYRKLCRHLDDSLQLLTEWGVCD